MLPGGADSVVLEATPYALRQAFPSSPFIYFTTGTTCSDPAGFIDYSQVQLTRRQAAVVNLFGTPPSVLASSWLYVSPPFPLPLQFPSGATASSRYNAATNVCQAGPFPVGGLWIIPLSRTQDFVTIFTAPYWTP